MRITGTQDEIWRELATPGMVEDLVLTEHLPWRMFPYQYAAVYCLARPYNRGIILDIGTYWGRSAWTLSLAAPKAKIASLEPVRFERARQATAARYNIKVVKAYSWDYLKKNHLVWDMVLVDGDHEQVERDLPWFNRLKDGGLILFHDYTPADAARCQNPHVYAVINGMAESLGREPDVLIVDSEKVGMAGFYRREGETLAL